jgi:hypothetical protein
VQRAGVDVGERYQRMTEFVIHYRYEPDLGDLRDVAKELYDEVGMIAMTLVTAKVRRIRERL